VEPEDFLKRTLGSDDVEVWLQTPHHQFLAEIRYGLLATHQSIEGWARLIHNDPKAQETVLAISSGTDIETTLQDCANYILQGAERLNILCKALAEYTSALSEPRDR
jgi:hypothetical protein